MSNRTSYTTGTFIRYHVLFGLAVFILLTIFTLSVVFMTSSVIGFDEGYSSNVKEISRLNESSDILIIDTVGNEFSLKAKIDIPYVVYPKINIGDTFTIFKSDESNNPNVCLRTPHSNYFNKGCFFSKSYDYDKNRIRTYTAIK